ncbi:hypothetical protein FAIPA1_140042 [Frankia sp. AiPs1]
MMVHEVVHIWPIAGSCDGVGVVSRVLPNRSSSGLSAAVTSFRKNELIAPVIASVIQPVIPPPPPSSLSGAAGVVCTDGGCAGVVGWAVPPPLLPLPLPLVPVGGTSQAKGRLPAGLGGAVGAAGLLVELPPGGVGEGPGAGSGVGLLGAGVAADGAAAGAGAACAAGASIEATTNSRSRSAAALTSHRPRPHGPPRGPWAERAPRARDTSDRSWLRVWAAQTAATVSRRRSA